MLSRRLLRIKNIKSLYAHFKSESDSLIASEKNFLASIDKAYDLYFQMLRLAVDVADYARERIEIGLNKKLPTFEELHPNMSFVENPVVRRIAACEELNGHLSRKALGWSREPELIKNIYNAFAASDAYKEYMAGETHTFREEKALIASLYVEQVQDNEMVEEVLEEQSILWSDDLDFALIMVVRTLDNMRANREEVPLLPEFKCEEDLEFAKVLFRKTLVNFAEYEKYFERFTENWDVERLAFMDMLIMASAMTELVAFPEIPVKVTMDEYIEISKYYSTPGSSIFINGMLDKIVAELTAENRINKTGLGLL